MHNIEDLHELCETISREIGDANEKIRSAGGKLSGEDLTYLDKLTHTLKSLKTTIAMEEADNGESGMYPYYRGRSYNDGMMNGGSYARRRDSMGRYSSRYSRDDDMISELRELMQDAPDQKTKQEFQRFISKLEQM